MKEEYEEAWREKGRERRMWDICQEFLCPKLKIMQRSHEISKHIHTLPHIQHAFVS
jgi:hypothetical protein